MNSQYSFGRSLLDPRAHAACVDIAVRAGALKACPHGQACFYRPCDNDAEIRVFTQAAVDFVNGDLAGYSTASIIYELYSILDEARIYSCSCEGGGWSTRH